MKHVKEQSEIEPWGILYYWGIQSEMEVLHKLRYSRKSQVFESLDTRLRRPIDNGEMLGVLG